jgi:hypothetical protein
LLDAFEPAAIYVFLGRSRGRGDRVLRRGRLRNAARIASESDARETDDFTQYFGLFRNKRSGANVHGLDGLEPGDGFLNVQLPNEWLRWNLANVWSFGTGFHCDRSRRGKLHVFTDGCRFEPGARYR